MKNCCLEEEEEEEEVIVIMPFLATDVTHDASSLPWPFNFCVRGAPLR